MDAMPHGGPDAGAPEPDPDLALARLEDVLGSLPFGRAVPDLDDLLRRAEVAPGVLQDERARKLLHEAILARPLSSIDAASRLRTEVELLTLEIEVLIVRLTDPGSDQVSLARTGARLDEVQARLAEIRDQL